MKPRIFLIVTVIFISFMSSAAYADVVISEIFFDAQDEVGLSRFFHQYVEVYNNGSGPVDLDGWTISDDSTNAPDPITDTGGGCGTVLQPGGFALITDMASNTKVYDPVAGFDIKKCSKRRLRLFVDDSAIGNGLRLSGDTVTLKDANGDLVDEVVYGGNWGLRTPSSGGVSSVAQGGSIERVYLTKGSSSGIDNFALALYVGFVEDSLSIGVLGEGSPNNRNFWNPGRVTKFLKFVNRASEDELDLAPFIGPVTAQKIVESRTYFSLSHFHSIFGARVFLEIVDWVYPQFNLTDGFPPGDNY
jgi:hypothetical protein